MKLAVVGATGMVGRVMLKVLEERNFPVDTLIPVASESSAGKMIQFRGHEYKLHTLEEAVDECPDIALFSAGGGVSKTWAPRFAEKGTFVIDNSSAWRMDKDIPLVVPEINADILSKETKIIANPNCSTIQLVMVLNPLRKAFGIEKCIISTYQSVTGTGKAAVEQLEAEAADSESVRSVYPHRIHKNVIPQCDVFDAEGYTKEEWKLMREPKKIMGEENISFSATAVRVPVQGGHSESVYLKLRKPADLTAIKKMLAETPGVVLQDNPEKYEYPMPLHSEGKNEVFVGRIRRDPDCEYGLQLWIVADNLRKGAATNTVQIAEYLLKHSIVNA